VLIALGESTPHDGKSLRASSTTPPGNSERGPRSIAVPNGKKEEDWVIRREAPLCRYVRQWRTFNDFMGKCVMRLTLADDRRR